jgi:formylglycine-generating enzyme required for sulfatase activity
MSNQKYLNFDLAIERSGDHYRARVLQSCAGEGSVEFALPFGEYELKYLLLQMGHHLGGSERHVHPSDSPELAAAKEFGTKLFSAVFQRDVYACLYASLNEARSSEQGLRVLLRLPPELTSLPWEYLYNPDWNQFFALALDTPLVRYLELTPPLHPLTIQPPLRVLVVIASPGDFAPLDVEREWRDLQAALQPLVERRLVKVDLLETPTLVALQSQLRRGKKYHIFHFIGHGQFSERQQDGRLVFCDEQGRGYLLSGQTLGTLLHNHPSLRLALLNACEGARTAQNDPFAGVAQTLVQMGLPAVIAMQYAISDSAAVRFAREFYLALADGYEVDAALTEARTAVFASQGSAEWGTPVLFTRVQDGRVFDVALPLPSSTQPLRSLENASALPVLPPPKAEQVSVASPQLAGSSGDVINGGECAPLIPERLSKPSGTPPPTAQDMELARLYQDGLSAFHLENWHRACECFQSVVQMRGDYRDAPLLLEKARREVARRRSNQGENDLLAWLSAHRRGIAVVGLVLIGLVSVIFAWTKLATILTPLIKGSATPDIRPSVTSELALIASPSQMPVVNVIVTPTPPPGMVLIPSGPFQMGSQDPQTILAECKKYLPDCSIDWFEGESPAHFVTLNAFWIDKYEVTNADYAKCVMAKTCSEPDKLSSNTRNEHYNNQQYANYPVLYVTWYQADAYCKWRTDGGRLPSEAEWEKAARGGLGGKLYPWGDEVPVCTAGAENGAQFNSCSLIDTVAVGSFAPNKYGLYDMAGNVWEWTMDWYDIDYYKSSPVQNPTGPQSGTDHIVRGGGWSDYPVALRVADRSWFSSSNSNPDLGFRCVATLKSPE